ncbi:hypothetical protein C7212DRAFT_289815 [Tuber magnatum]|uniref:Protein Zds1 C-terminal domain-containing protein n=1 Tax=Tuber magnatum TaxID=42249 RepID=A0A317T4U9_9PEZI|nr:hypothetical protein C7212DRAFT_289815 [Tuber magnatum]
MPILNAAPGGAALRRSTRTTYRRGSLRKGERVPHSKRAARPLETDAEDSSPASSPIVSKGGFRFERVSTEPIPLPTAHKDEPDDYPRRLSQRGSATKAGSLSVSIDDFKLSEKHKSAPAKQRRASSPKGSSRSRQSEPIPPVPVIVETPPPEQPQKLIIPERHSSFDAPPQLASQQITQVPELAKPQRPALQRTQASEVVTEVVSSPTAPPNKGPEPAPLLDPGKADGKERKRPDSAGSNDGGAGRKSSWGWLLGDSADKTKEREKDHHHHHHHEKKDKEEKTKARKEKRPKSADKHDNTRLDLLQKSIDLGNTGKVITSDTNGAKTDEKEARKPRGEDKKEKEGLFAFFGSSRKKSGSDGAQKTKGSSSSRGVSPDPAHHQPQQTYYYARFPIHIERAIYRLSHLKLANPRRPLQQQVLLSNFMYSYLAKVQQTQPHLVQQATISQPSKEQQKQQQQQQQQQQQSEQQSNQYYQYDNGSNESDYVDDSQMYDDEASDMDRPQSRAAQYTSKQAPEDGDGHYDQQPEPRREWEGDRDRDRDHGGSRSSKSRSAKLVSHEPKPASDDMW